MKKIISSALLLSSMLLIMTGFTEGEKEISVKKVNLQVLSTQNIDDTTIDLYTSNGWVYNQVAQQLEREVTYADEEIVIDGEIYTTDAEGEVEVNLDHSGDSEIKISSDTLMDLDDTVTQVIDKDSLNDGEQIIIQEVIDIDQVIESMDDASLNDSETENQKNEGSTQVGGLSNGQLPKRGSYVHCNRFNGYLGNGRYYSKTSNPVKAATNFIASDCDFALLKSTKCLV